MVKLGEHITLDIIGTKREYSPSFFEKLLYKIAKKAKVTVLEISTHKFEPQGFTLVALLAESHMSFHTFPEHRIISFDFFTCGKITPSVALEIIKNEIEHKRIIKKDIFTSAFAYFSFSFANCSTNLAASAFLLLQLSSRAKCKAAALVWGIVKS